MNDELVEQATQWAAVLNDSIYKGDNADGKVIDALLDRIERLTAQLARARQEGWQPIETAPEWEEVIVYYGGRQRRKSQKTCIATAVNVGFGKWELGSMPPLHLAPTHWMPFPAPPANPSAADPVRGTLGDSDGDDGA